LYLPALGGQLQPSDPDDLYRQRENLGAARQAAELWGQRLKANGQDFESAWKLARTYYWLGGHAPEKERKDFLEAGIAAGRTAATLEPRRPEGFFWIAANMGALAESFGLRQGLKYRGDIRDNLQIALKLDPAFQHGSPDRALGRWYHKVPGLFGGSRKRAEEHLRRSLAYNQNSIVTHFFLAELLLDMDRRGEAIAELQKVLDLPVDPEWGPEDRGFKQQAQKLMMTLRQRQYL
jgi:tetratricopeptide (TPR) repeat protein